MPLTSGASGGSATRLRTLRGNVSFARLCAFATIAAIFLICLPLWGVSRLLARPTQHDVEDSLAGDTVRRPPPPPERYAVDGSNEDPSGGQTDVHLAAFEATDSPEALERWAGVKVSKKLPTARDVAFLDAVLGREAIGAYPLHLRGTFGREGEGVRTDCGGNHFQKNDSSSVHHPKRSEGHPHCPLRTFDDMIEDTMSTEHYRHNLPLAPETRPLRPCDPNSAPFADSTAHRRCVAFLRNVLGAAFAVASAGGYTHHTDEFEVKLAPEYRWVLRQEPSKGDDGGSEGGSSPSETTTSGSAAGAGSDGNEERDSDDDTLFYVSLAPLLPKFEQRTIKYRCSIWNRQRTAVLGAIIKVPQMLFPREPFSEVMAHRLDRLLGINRVPPMALLVADVGVLQNISTHRATRHVPMDPEFLQESRVTSYDEWIARDLVSFVRNNKGVHYVAPNRTHVHITAQLFMNEVRPLLESQLIVPYSKKNPGWHRWFIPGWAEMPINNASLYGLSELAIFDFITMNSDRSPNKNNFAIGGCKRCGPERRRPSGLAPTLLHLDQGMALWGSGHILSHSPIGKQRDKVKFCIFYKPLMAAIYQRLRADGDNLDRTRQWFLRGAHPAAVRALGKGLLGEVAEQMWRVLRRLLVCLKDEGFSMEDVLRPSDVHWS